MFFYSWAYQLDIYLVTVFFIFNVQMFNIAKKMFLQISHTNWTLLVYI